MIDEVFPRAHRRYSTLPLLGAVAADFTRWLHAQGLQPQTLRQHLAAMRYIDQVLRRRGMRQLHELVVDDLRSCWQGCRRCRTHLSATANALGVFLTERSVVTPSASPVSATATLVTA